MKYNVNLTLIYNGYATIEANSEQEAIQKAQESLNYETLAPFPESVDIPNGSFSFGEATADYADPEPDDELEPEPEPEAPYNPELNKKLFELYQKAAYYINHAGAAPEDALVSEDFLEDCQLDIINNAADIAVEFQSELEASPAYADIHHILGLCLCSVNHDFESGKEPTLEEYIADDYELIEQLSGFLGTYFE